MSSVMTALSNRASSDQYLRSRRDSSRGSLDAQSDTMPTAVRSPVNWPGSNMVKVSSRGSGAWQRRSSSSRADDSTAIRASRAATAAASSSSFSVFGGAGVSCRVAPQTASEPKHAAWSPFLSGPQAIESDSSRQDNSRANLLMQLISSAAHIHTGQTSTHNGASADIASSLRRLGTGQLFPSHAAANAAAQQQQQQEPRHEPRQWPSSRSGSVTSFASQRQQGGQAQQSPQRQQQFELQRLEQQRQQHDEIEAWFSCNNASDNGVAEGAAAQQQQQDVEQQEPWWAQTEAGNGRPRSAPATAVQVPWYMEQQMMMQQQEQQQQAVQHDPQCDPQDPQCFWRFSGDALDSSAASIPAAAAVMGSSSSSSRQPPRVRRHHSQLVLCYASSFSNDTLVPPMPRRMARTASAPCRERFAGDGSPAAAAQAAAVAEFAARAALEQVMEDAQEMQREMQALSSSLRLQLAAVHQQQQALHAVVAVLPEIATAEMQPFRVALAAELRRLAAQNQSLTERLRVLSFSVVSLRDVVHSVLPCAYLSAEDKLELCEAMLLDIRNRSSMTKSRPFTREPVSPPSHLAKHAGASAAQPEQPAARVADWVYESALYRLSEPVSCNGSAKALSGGAKLSEDAQRAREATAAAAAEAQDWGSFYTNALTSSQMALIANTLASDGSQFTKGLFTPGTPSPGSSDTDRASGGTSESGPSSGSEIATATATATAVDVDEKFTESKRIVGRNRPRHVSPPLRSHDGRSIEVLGRQRSAPLDLPPVQFELQPEATVGQFQLQPPAAAERRLSRSPSPPQLELPLSAAQQVLLSPGITSSCPTSGPQSALSSGQSSGPFATPATSPIWDSAYQGGAPEILSQQANAGSWAVNKPTAAARGKATASSRGSAFSGFDVSSPSAAAAAAATVVGRAAEPRQTRQELDHQRQLDQQLAGLTVKDLAELLAPVMAYAADAPADQALSMLLARRMG